MAAGAARPRGGFRGVKRYWSRAGEPSSCIWSEIDWEGSMAREASRDSESHNISLMRTGPAELFC